jgi:hypothetical protein
MSALSRRSIVASAAALPALAVPAVVSAAPKFLNCVGDSSGEHRVSASQSETIYLAANNPAFIVLLKTHFIPSS